MSGFAASFGWVAPRAGSLLFFFFLAGRAGVPASDAGARSGLDCFTSTAWCSSDDDFSFLEGAKTEAELKAKIVDLQSQLSKSKQNLKKVR